MKTLIAAACLVGASWAAVAQTPAAAPGGGREPQIRRIVVEDEAIRIDELRVRGQAQRITVTPKNSRAGAYEIVPDNLGRDPSQPKGLTGQRVWTLFSF